MPKIHVLVKIRLVIFMCILAFSFVFINETYSSKVVTHDIESKAIGINTIGISNVRTIEVYLPDGYEKGNNRYPVIYWLPGWTGGRGDLQNIYKNDIDNAITDNKIPPTIVVSVDVHEGLLMLNSPVFGNWEDFIVSELIQFIDKTYPTIQDPLARALMGHSLGGYTAMMLPILHPNVWGSIGGNDPYNAIMWYYVADEADISDAYKADYNFMKSGLFSLPNEINISILSNYVNMIPVWFGTELSPNPGKPLKCDIPIAPDGNWVPDVREKWSAYNLADQKIIAKHINTLKKLLTITIVVPEILDPNQTNSASNMYLIDQMQSVGITINTLNMPGGHMTDMSGRFVALVEQALKAMQGSGTSVSPQESLIST